jgi:two-component system, sensor histidine kinase and response regulator
MVDYGGLTGLALQSDISVKTHDYLSKISNSSRSLLRIINDILDYSKIEAGKLDLEQENFLIREIFDHLSDMFRPHISEKNIELIIHMSKECRYELVGDALRLEQILMNLISNAIKFTNEGEVVVMVETTSESDREVALHFSVKDTGIGLTSEQKTKLFTPFTQADTSTTRKFGGTGLGLSISQRLSNLMNGLIWVDMEHAPGSLFHFNATFARNIEVESQDMCLPKEMEKLRVLVVDDNASSRESLWTMLSMFGFTVYSVSSGSKALQEIQDSLSHQKPFHLVLIDWFMPDLNGLETVELIKKNIPVAKLPKILFLGPSNKVDKFNSSDASVGVDAYLSKPINCSILFDAIMEVFGQSVTKSFRGSRGKIDLSEIIKLIGGARVLLVEDNAINQQVASEILESIGLIIEVAENGVEAVRMVSEAEYDVVLMDIQMPEMDGHTATQRIRADERFAKLPIIAMTAHAMAGDREKSIASGMNDHVSKPIDKKKLFAALTKWIEKKERTLPNFPLQGPGIGDVLKLPLELPGINVASALERINHNDKLLRSILFEFHNSFASSALEVRRLLQGKRQGDQESALNLVHTIKGMAGNISAKTLFETLSALEIAIKESQLEKWSTLLDSFESSLGQVVESIGILKHTEEAAAKESTKNNKTDKIDIEAVVPYMQKLFEGINDSYFQTIEIFEHLKPLLANSNTGIQKDLEQLEKNIDQLDFEIAMVTFAELRKKLGISPT